MSVNVLASEGDLNNAPSLDELISQNQEQQTEGSISENEVVHKSNADFIKELEDASDLSEQAEGIETITSGIKTVASYVIQVLCYAVTILLVLRVVLDLAYIGLPFIRSFLANGYQGNAQAGAGGMPNSMAAGGMGGMSGSRGSGGVGMGGMYAQNNMNSLNNSVTSNNTINSTRVQLVSNAALNAIAAESSIGPDGKAVSPFKLYVKDMVVVLILVPVLLTLAVTGALTNLGFFIGSIIVDAISGISSMIG